MGIDAQSTALLLALLLKLLRWLLHILFATGYIILCRWLYQIRNHDFYEQHRIIDRRYCLVALIFYALAAAVHLVSILAMVLHTKHAIAGHTSHRQEEEEEEYATRETGARTRFARLCLLAVFLTIWVLPDIVLLLPYMRWLARFTANHEGRNVSYTIACIAVSVFNISVAAFALLGGLAHFMWHVIRDILMYRAEKGEHPA